jgi:large subunit ribosomal protein L11
MPPHRRVATTAKLQLDAGEASPGADAPIAKLGRDQLREVARVKLPDLNTTDLEAAERIAAGTARSMGIEVVDPG